MEEVHKNGFKSYYADLINNMDKHSLAMELSLIIAIKEHIHFINNTSLWNQFVCMEECLNDEIWARGINESMKPIID